MPSTPLAVQPTTGEQTVAPDPRGLAPATPDHDASDAKARLPRRAATARTRSNHWRHAINSMRQVFKTNYYDPKFQRPDRVEDDYYRFRNQPRG
jgi:hypothetical protein